MEHDIFLT